MMQTNWELEAEIEVLETRIKRLEDFITRDRNDWDTSDLMLEQDSLKSSIKSTVDESFYVSVSAKLESSS
jgi:hypothetical protein